MATYKTTTITTDGLVVTTPTEGATTIAELNNAIREIKYALNHNADILITTTNVTLGVTHGVVFTNGVHTVTLPQVSTVADQNSYQGATKWYYIVNKHASAISQVKTYSGEKIDGVDYSTDELQIPPGGTLIISTDGTDWFSFDAMRGANLADICELQRAQFSWKDADEFYLDSGAYLHVGTKTQTLSWDIQLTFQVSAGGSNADSSAVGTSEWQYIYIDDSALTPGLRILVAADFLTSTDAPAYDAAKKGWYGGQGAENDTSSDRCIGAMWIDGSGNVTEFSHDGGDLFNYDTDIIDRAYAVLPTTAAWETVTCTLPGFCTKAEFQLEHYSNTASEIEIYGRRKGSSGKNIIGWHFNPEYSSDRVPLFTNASQQIEIATNIGASAFMALSSAGFYFPRGM